MMHRLRSVTLGSIAAVAVAAGGCRPADARGGNDATIAARGYEGVAIQPPLAKPGFTLARAPGETPFDFRRRTDGYATLLYFGYTNCPDICPVHLANIAAVLRNASYDVRSRVKVVFVTVDPTRDTPAVLASWLAGFDSTFIGLRGDDSTITAVQHALRLTPARVMPSSHMAGGPGAYAVGHAAQVMAFTADGRGVAMYPFGTRQEQWAHDLPLLVADSVPPGPRPAGR